MKKLLAPALVVLLTASTAGCSTLRDWWGDDRPAARPAPAKAVVAPPPAPASAPAVQPAPPPPPPPPVVQAPEPPPAVSAAAAYCAEAGGTVVGSLIYQAGDARPACQIGASDWDLEDFQRYNVPARLRANAPS